MPQKPTCICGECIKCKRRKIEQNYILRKKTGLPPRYSNYTPRPKKEKPIDVSDLSLPYEELDERMTQYFLDKGYDKEEYV